jgi:membrane-associated phospholipid phosphatase
VVTDPRGRRCLWAVAAVVALILLTADLLLGGPIRTLDAAISRTVVAHADASWRPVLVPLSYLGQRGFVVVPLLALTVLALWRTRSARPLAVVAGTLVTTTLLVGVMKLGFGRTAPASGQDVLGTDALSYPSGHAVNTIIIWTLVLRILVGLYGHRVRLLGKPLTRLTLVAAIALANAAAMLGLNYHWLSDVLAGWLIGVTIALLVPSPLPAWYRPATEVGAAPSATRGASRRGSGRPVPSA